MKGYKLIYRQIRYSFSIWISFEGVLAAVISRFKHRYALKKVKVKVKTEICTKHSVAKWAGWKAICYYETWSDATQNKSKNLQQEFCINLHSRKNSLVFEYILIINYSYSYLVVFSDRMIFVFGGNFLTNSIRNCIR